MYKFDNTLIEAKLKSMGIGPIVVASKLKCASHMTVRKWIEGYSPKVDALVEFCNVFNINLTEFFFQENEQIDQNSIQIKKEVQLKTLPDKNDDFKLKLAEYLEVQKITREETREELKSEFQRISDFYERQILAKNELIQELQQKNAELKARIEYLSSKDTYNRFALSDTEVESLYTKK